MNKVNFLFWVILFLTMGFSSCNSSGNFYDNSQNISNGWKVSDTIVFDVKKDSLNNKNYNIFFVIRNNNDYPYRNIYFITSMITPQGKEINDTLEYQLAAANGEWLGHGMGAVKQNKLVYKDNIMLKDTGTYQFKIIHGMRNDTLLGIEGLSLLIDEINNDK